MEKKLNLFNIVPANYFSLFSGKNKEIYIESLLLLFQMLEEDETIIKKEDYLSALKEKGAKYIEQFSYKDEELDFDNDQPLLSETLVNKAGFIVKRLEETGWIDVAMDTETMEETIVIPAYSIMLLKAIEDIISDEQSPYLSLVHSTFSELQIEDIEQDDMLLVTLYRAFDNTKKLKIELLTLINSIRIFKNRLGKVFDTNDVLSDYFDLYKSKVIDKYYHPLKTFDSVVKFKRPILKILDRWLTTKEIRDKLIMQGLILNKNADRKSIENEIITKINYISDTYESMNSLINNIDKENSEYTKSSTEKILYLNNTDKTIKGHLENIFKYYARNIDDNRTLAKILTGMQDSIYFHEQGYFDKYSSVTLPILRKLRDSSEPLEITDFDLATEYIMENFLAETQNDFTDERVYEFMENAFGSANEIGVLDIPLLNYEAFILLILATIKKNDVECFYEVEIVDGEKLFNHEYVVPNIIFRRKELREDV